MGIGGLEAAFRPLSFCVCRPILFPMNGRIIVDPQICSGKPVIRGTRIMVKNILGMAAGGYTVERIVQAYPELTPDDVSAAMEYAAEAMAEEQIFIHA